MLSRRTFVAGGMTLGGALTFLGFETPRSAGAQPLADPAPPASIFVRRSRFENWDRAIVTDELWTALPATASEVVELVDWAVAAGYRLRPQGRRHSWSPLTVSPGTSADSRVLLVDMSRLAGMRMVGDAVEVEAGALMVDLLAFLDANGRSLRAAPAVGDISVGGALAVAAHGTGVPTGDDAQALWSGFATLGGLVRSMTAVVWDPGSDSYRQRQFDRSHPDTKALVSHLGRVMVTSVTLTTVPAYNLHCRNLTDIPIAELFAAPATAGPRSLARLIDEHGRVGIAWYAFTDFPWVQTWSEAPTCPPSARTTSGPFNYPFADTLPDAIPRALSDLIEGNVSAAPTFCNGVLTVTEAGLDAVGARDMWGPAKNFINFVRPSTLRITAGSHVVVTRRADIQTVVHEFTTVYLDLLAQYRAAGEFPVNSGLEIRITTVDSVVDLDIPGAEPPALSPTAPVPGRPEWDTAIWLDVITLPHTRSHERFFADLERRFFRTFPADRGVVRPEWSKRWAHGPAGAWTDDDYIRRVLPEVLPMWHWAADTFDRYDPSGVFRSDLADRLMPR